MGAVKDTDQFGRTVVINGEEYDATPEALKELEKRGVKYDAPEKGMWQNMRDTVQDFGRGAAHGASFGLADMQFGDDQQSVMQRLGGDNYDAVKARSPMASTVGDVSGSALSPLSKIGAAAKGANFAVRAGRAALGAGTESLTRGIADAGTDITQDEATNALEQGESGAKTGAGVSAGLSALGAAASSPWARAAAQLIGKAVSKGADTSRLKGAGFVIKDIKDLARKEGQHADDFSSDKADLIEQLSPSPTLGQTAGDKARNFEDIRMSRGKEIGAALDEGGSREGLDAFIPDSKGQQGVWTNIQQRLRSKADGLPEATSGENALKSNVSGFADRLAQEAPPSSLGALHKRVTNFADEAYGMNKANKQVSTLENSTGAQSAEMGRDIARDELGQLIDNYATPETATHFKEGMKGFSDVADLERVAKDRALSEAGNSNVMGMLAAPILAGAGGLLTGGVGGMALGAGMAANTGTRNAFRQMAETSRGFDVAANAQRALARMLGHSKTGPSAAGAKLAQLRDVLSRQGNRRGLVAMEGYINDRDDEE